MYALPADPRRTFPRYKSFVATHARCRGSEVRAHVLDVAQGGARVHTERRLSVADRVTIRLRGRPVAGTIVWNRGTKSGVSFDVPLTMNDVQQIFDGA